MDKLTELVCSVVAIAPAVVGKVAEGVVGVCAVAGKLLCGAP